MALTLLLLTPHASTSFPVSQLVGTKPWCEARIDYSAANEFIAAHYGKTRYFEKDRKTEPIYNAREGVQQHLQDEGTHYRPASLSECGFTLVQQEKPADTDWTDLNSIRETYLPRVRDALLTVYGAGGESSNLSADVIFWCPTLRLENAAQTPRDGRALETPKSGYVATAHIDTDVNAYETVQQFVDMVYKNRFPGTNFNARELVTALSDGRARRFSIVNAWRNIGDAPIKRAPLALMPSRYAQPDAAFPNAIPDHQSSCWYTYPNMTPNELLLFCQYDRDASQPSDVWHCALTEIGNDDSGPPRQSFDVRCLVLFHQETVPQHRDRLRHHDGNPSLLNYKESQTFCSEQAARRLLPSNKGDGDAKPIA